MKTKVFLPVLLSVLVLLSSCIVYKTTSYVDVPTKCVGSELDGTYILRVAGKGSNMFAAKRQAKKQAVYDIVFTTIPANGVSGKSSLTPIVTNINIKEQHQEYFDNFFAKGGEYTKYISTKSRRSGTTEYTKTNVQVVCVTTVSVDREAIKAKLRKDGIINY